MQLKSSKFTELIHVQQISDSFPELPKNCSRSQEDLAKLTVKEIQEKQLKVRVIGRFEHIKILSP